MKFSGRERVLKVADQIADRCREVAEECVDPYYLENVETSKVKLKPSLKPEKVDDPDCNLFLAHGPAMTKVTQRYMIDRLGKRWKPCATRLGSSKVSKDRHDTTWIHRSLELEMVILI